MGKKLLKIIIGLFFIILMAVSCRKGKSVFNKSNYLEECGITLDKMLISEKEEDSLSHIVFSQFSLNKNLRDEFIKDTNFESCNNLLQAFSKKSFYQGLSHNDSLSFNHYYAKSILMAKEQSDIIGLTLSYANGQNTEIKKRIGETSFLYTKDFDDSLAFCSIKCILSAINKYSDFSHFLSPLGLEKDAISDSDAKQILYWSKEGLKYSKYGYLDRILENLTYCSWKLNYPQFSEYSDSLISYQFQHHKSVFLDNFFQGALYDRYIQLLKIKNYDYAARLLDYYCPSIENTDSIYIPVKKVLPDREPPQEKDLIVWLLIQSSKRGGLDLATLCFFEKARLSYLRDDKNYSVWLNRAFYEGLYNTFPSSSPEYIDYYIRPFFQYDPKYINILTLQYNNEDPRAVYDALLFVKSASETIPSDIYKFIKSNSTNEVISYVDSVRNYGIDIRPGKERDYLEKKIGPKIKDILKSNIVSYSDIQTHLGNNEAAIEFYAVPSLSIDGDYYYRAAVLTSDNIIPRIVNIGSDEKIKKLVLSRILYQNCDAYSAIWAPLEDLLKNKSTVYFSTDRILNVCNSQALLLPDNRRLGQKYNLIQLSSTREILNSTSRRDIKSIAIFGGIDYTSSNNKTQGVNDPSYFRSTISDSLLRSFSRDSFTPLTYSQKEIDSIATLARKIGATVYYYSSLDGTEDNFKGLSGCSLSVLHIATHGFYYTRNQSKEIGFLNLLNNPDNPLERCGLLLAGSKNKWENPQSQTTCEDGILLGEEIARLDLSDVDLVVLSACETALGDINSEGVVGLRQAFKRAGVKTALVSLNRIDDKATSFFMSSFYEKLFETKDKRESFNYAIDQMKVSNNYSDSSFWTPFVMID